MFVLISDSQFQSVALVAVAFVGIVPATLAAFWARTAKNNSDEAKTNSASALYEVSTNGGMTSPVPNLNDHVKYQTEMIEESLTLSRQNAEKLSNHIAESEEVKKDITAHIEHSKVMDLALAEVYLKVKPGMTIDINQESS